MFASSLRHASSLCFLLSFSLVACGGAVEGADTTNDAGSDAPPNNGDSGVVTTVDGSSSGCPTDIASSVGASCDQEGLSCGGPCTDVCSFCNGIACQNGIWTEYEVFPEPCDDASVRLYPDARMTWQAPGGFSGFGPAVVVAGDGTVSVWSSLPSFDPTTVPVPSPTNTFKVTGAQVDDLFSRWLAVDVKSLPHAGSGGDCYAAVSAKTCATCADSTLRYQDSGLVAPDMTSVWDWFATTLPSVAAAHTGDYCHLE